jgi:hypothetical protein
MIATLFEPQSLEIVVMSPKVLLKYYTLFDTTEPLNIVPHCSALEIRSENKQVDLP